jgi:hypothetical protein
MGTKGRVSLKALGGAIAIGPPTIDEARASLGGRASTSARAGERVRVKSTRREGVVVFASESEVDVWIGDGRLQRVAPGECERSERGERELDAVAADARRYGALVEGEEVTFLDRSDRAHPGTLVEKCRYGALVLDRGGKVVAVGFRRVSRSAGD